MRKWKNYYNAKNIKNIKNTKKYWKYRSGEERLVGVGEDPRLATWTWIEREHTRNP